MRHRTYTCLVQMGRTIRTFREAIDFESAKWKTFRRQLRPDDRERFDRIFYYARMHADSGINRFRMQKEEEVFQQDRNRKGKRISNHQRDTKVLQEITSG